MNVEQRISTSKSCIDKSTHCSKSTILRIARLQLDQFLPAGLAHGRIDCRFSLAALLMRTTRQSIALER